MKGWTAAFAAAVLIAAASCTPRPRYVPPPAPLPPAPTETPEQAAAERATQAQAAWNEGTRLGREAHWPQAERQYRQAISLEPDSVKYQMALSTALVQQGRDSEAADVLQGAIRREETAPNPNHRLIAVDYERLIQLLERANRLDEARTARERQRFHRTMRDAAPPD
jgi:tetratricopeptide (TPR) repeat protein